MAPVVRNRITSQNLRPSEMPLIRRQCEALFTGRLYLGTNAMLGATKPTVFPRKVVAFTVQHYQSLYASVFFLSFLVVFFFLPLRGGVSYFLYFCLSNLFLFLAFIFPVFF